MELERTRKIKLILSQCRSLVNSTKNTLNDTSSEIGRYSTFVQYAERYNRLAEEVIKLLRVQEPIVKSYNVKDINSSNRTWPFQKAIIESVQIDTKFLISYLENSLEFSEDEFNNLENFIKAKLRSTIFDIPEKEKVVQNSIESLFIGKNWIKGIDYDRESGKFHFSGREYIPDFTIPKLNLAIEVKLLRDGKKSQIIEEVNADITAYSKQYAKQLYIIYDLGVIRDEIEFKRDIESSGEDIKVVIIKH